MRSLIAEFSAAGRISSRTMESTMWNSYTLVTSFPVTFQALEDARISPTHARIIVDAGAQISDQQQRFAYEIAAVDYASGESPNRVRSVARMLAAKHGGVTSAERRKQGHNSRRVWVDDFDDGSAELHILTSAVLAHAALDRLSRLAHIAKDPNSSEVRPVLGDVEREPVGYEDESLIPEQDVQDVDGDHSTAAPNDDPRTMDPISIRSIAGRRGSCLVDESSGRVHAAKSSLIILSHACSSSDSSIAPFCRHLACLVRHAVDTP